MGGEKERWKRRKGEKREENVGEEAWRKQRRKYGRIRKCGRSEKVEG